MIKWENIKDEDLRVIHTILQLTYNSLSLGERTAVGNMFEREMGMVACHISGCPLDLPRMLYASSQINFVDHVKFDLVHDIFGISNHIDRDTGKLDRMFLPRFAL